MESTQDTNDLCSNTQSLAHAVSFTSVAMVILEEGLLLMPSSLSEGLLMGKDHIVLCFMGVFHVGLLLVIGFVMFLFACLAVLRLEVDRRLTARRLLTGREGSRQSL